ncbi:hypothetical protein M2352_000517 [Azospirillum fermentarium]|uniref:hypothetical protein n=1 Tax=Azospirillum fermentarium TaxID=1233114 RepID=UPI00222802AE|nr:hypothetical protein [Azospirillum fermentarium]MCW2244926.1 hypothetical protein [Azospirillum fermentarium]
MNDDHLKVYIARCAIDLHKLLKDLTRQHFETPTYRIICFPSMRILGDVVQQWDLELRQLAVWQKNGIRPTKSMASLSFWIKKLKPVRAFTVLRTQGGSSLGASHCPICGNTADNVSLSSEVREERERIAREHFENEIADINERLALILAIQQLVDYLTGNEYLRHRIIINEDTNHFNKGDISNFLERYFKQKLGNGESTIYDNLLFNMRYRSFSTHHLVHILDQLLFALTHTNGEKKQASRKR